MGEQAAKLIFGLRVPPVFRDTSTKDKKINAYFYSLNDYMENLEVIHTDTDMFLGIVIARCYFHGVVQPHKIIEAMSKFSDLLEEFNKEQEIGYEHIAYDFLCTEPELHLAAYYS